MNRQRVRSARKSASVTHVPATRARTRCHSWCGRSNSLSRRPSSPITSSVLGWSVSPRKSRRKSACFSSTTTSIPARARSSPSIIPAGPPPAMHVTFAPAMPDLSSVGLAVPEILLPAKGVDLARWAVVACDQYTSEPEYWKAADARVGAAPSALRLVLPEAWLGAAEEPARIAAIQRAMSDYLAGGVFAPARRGFVLVDRSTPHVASR